MARKRLDYLIVVHDRRGRGLRRYFGAFRGAARPGELVERINRRSRERGPRLEDGEPAIVAGVAWLHGGAEATAREAVDDAPHPDTGLRPGEKPRG
jgi:hypothetical protein